MSKELKIVGALGKDYQQIYVDGEPTGIEINGEGKVRIKDLVVDETIFANNETLKLMNGKVIIPATDKIYFDGGTETYITESASDVLDFYSGGDKMLSLDDASDSITIGAGRWVAGTVSGGTVTEFSSPGSAFAGMILGYRMIGEDAAHATYTMTSSFAVPNSDMTVRFVAPPSGCVEVMVQIYANASTSNRLLYFGLSDNATYNSIGATYEQLHRMPDETDDTLVQHYWTITGLSSGSIYNYWFGAKISGTSAFLNWGGTASTRYADFIMKVTALPSVTSDFAEYD